MAAGWLLITEAGGQVTQYDAAPVRLDSPTMIAGNGRPAIHEGIRAAMSHV
jgi:fructose-1,6-bisphosphatase/inositol monophosphatase family enzyme